MTLPITKAGRRLLQQAERIREDLHRHPELGFQETRTSAIVAKHLRDAGLDEVRTGLAQTGVVGVLRGGRPGLTVALRADMDAVPIREETGLPYASVNDGVMHACGHDGHTAVLLATATLLARHRDEIRGAVKFIFQPAEERLAGGRRMVEDGCLQEPPVDGIFALHSASNLKPGQIRLSPTPYAGMNGFQIDIRGKGGHGAMPHTTVDPISIGSQIVAVAHTVVSRETAPDLPVVLSFGSFQAGESSNVIPDSARLLGTIRATEMKTLRKIRRSLERIARDVAHSMRGKAVVTDEEVYPPVKNDPALLALVRSVGEELLGKRNVLDVRGQRMASEDFAFYLADQGGVPGAIFWLGIGTDVNFHNAHFDFGSAALEPGILMMANVALSFLSSPSGER